jgi:hypothetical protein
MSVLSFPRIYFSGYMEWSPNTTNNNDYLPTYDAADALLNFGFLNQQTPPIMLDNVQQTFPPWVIEPLVDSCPPDPKHPSSHAPSRWNYYGGNDCKFVQFKDFTTVVKGGVLNNHSPASPSDPIVGQQLALLGSDGTPARMVDINPASPFCTQIFFATLAVGSGATSIVTAAPPAGQALPRMYTRSFFVPRNTAKDLIIAGAIGVVFQAALPTEWIKIQNGGNSDLLASFDQALSAPEGQAQGLMLRFAAYTTLYYRNGIFNEIGFRPHNDEALLALYQKVQAGTIEPFVNPAYSVITGAIGMWDQGELATAPGGHMLVPSAALTPQPGSADLATLRTRGPIRLVGHGVAEDAPAAGGEAAAASSGGLNLGVIHAELNPDAPTPLISLDLMNAFPESDVAGTRYDFGSFDVGVLMASDPSAPDLEGTFNVIGSFGSDQYGQAFYQANGGIVDVPFVQGVTPEDAKAWSDGGLLALRVQGQDQIASLELPLTVETDDRGVYVDQGATQTINLQVRYRDGRPPAGTQVLVAQYYPEPLTLGSGALGLLQPGSGGDGDVCTETPNVAYVSLPATPLPVDENGNATLPLSAVTPGFPVLAFYAFLAGKNQPTPQKQIIFPFQRYDTFSLGSAFFSTVRVMSFDDDLICDFVDQWNLGSPGPPPIPPFDSGGAWSFIYNSIFLPYDMIYPVMKKFVDLGSQSAVQGSIKRILALTSAPGVEGNTLYMPITRELSAGCREVLRVWGGLVEAGFPQRPLTKPRSCDQARAAAAAGRGGRPARWRRGLTPTRFQPLDES